MKKMLIVLVVALVATGAWRFSKQREARAMASREQGAPPVRVASPVAATPGSGRTAAPVEAASDPYSQPYEAADEAVEELVEDGYASGAVETHSDDATAIGGAPRGDYDENPTELASESGQIRNQRNDW